MHSVELSRFTGSCLFHKSTSDSLLSFSLGRKGFHKSHHRHFGIAIIFFYVAWNQNECTFFKDQAHRKCPLRNRVVRGCVSIIYMRKGSLHNLLNLVLRDLMITYPLHFLALYLDQTCKCEECLQITLEVLMKLLH